MDKNWLAVIFSVSKLGPEEIILVVLLVNSGVSYDKVLISNYFQ